MGPGPTIIPQAAGKEESSYLSPESRQHNTGLYSLERIPKYNVQRAFFIVLPTRCGRRRHHQKVLDAATRAPGRLLGSLSNLSVPPGQ